MGIEYDSKLKLIYNEAYRFIKSKVKNEIFKMHLEHYEDLKFESMNDIFKRMIITLKNRKGRLKMIVSIKEIDDILFGFDSKNVFKEYLYWKELCQEFKRKFGEKYKIDISNKRNVWVQFSMGIMSCARYLGNFNNIEEFDKHVRFFLSKNLVHELPRVLEREIYGYGFALSCDFLKELGYADYGKPDVHIKEIFKELKIVDSKNDFDFFKKILEIGEAVNERPAIVDKVFWLIGSGNFHLSDIKIGSKKKEFIKYIKKKYPKVFLD